MRILKSLIPFLVLVSSLYSQTATTPPTTPPPPAEPPVESLPPEFREVEEEERRHGGDHFTQDLLKLLATLGMMVGLIYLISYMLRKAMNKSQLKINETSGIKILESRSISQRSAVYLIEVEGREYVIADSTNGVTLLDSPPRTRKE